MREYLRAGLVLLVAGSSLACSGRLEEKSKPLPEKSAEQNTVTINFPDASSTLTFPNREVLANGSVSHQLNPGVLVDNPRTYHMIQPPDQDFKMLISLTRTSPEGRLTLPIKRGGGTVIITIFLGSRSDPAPKDTLIGTSNQWRLDTSNNITANWNQFCLENPQLNGEPFPYGQNENCINQKFTPNQA